MKRKGEKMIINLFSPKKKKVTDTKTTHKILGALQFHTGRKETVLICGFIVSGTHFPGGMTSSTAFHWHAGVAEFWETIWHKNYFTEP